MMSKKKFVVGMIVWGFYLLLGGTFYFHTEHALERDKRLNFRKERIEIFELLNKHYVSTHPGDNELIYNKLEAYCGRAVTNTTLEDDESDGVYLWNPFNAFLFCFTVISTVGYGNLAPTSSYGRILMIFYALIGIPFNAILFATLGDYFTTVIHRIQDRYKTRRIETRMTMFGDITMYISTGILVFIFLPACAFVYMEQWTWDLAIYYAFVTISTIGFGDFVAAQQPEIGHGEVWFTVYRIALITWMIFGLGYFFMILGFLTRGMRSKKLKEMEKKLAKNIKETQAKFWHGFTKDVGYLRRVLNEIHLARVKPVYRDEEESRSLHEPLTRSNSVPNLQGTEAAEDACPYGVWRRRATSEAIYGSLTRVVSDTHLDKIDRAATFRDTTPLNPMDLLAHVVSALGPPSYEQDEDMEGGIQGFSEEDILTSEAWSIASEQKTLEREKEEEGDRIMNEVRIPMDEVPSEPTAHAQWTWSGVPTSRHIHELMRARQKRRETISISEERPNRRTSSKSGSLLERWHSSKKRHKAKSLGALILGKPAAATTNTSAGYTQQNYMTHIGATRPPRGENMHTMLEETTVGEFLRALTSLHSRVGVMQHSLPPAAAPSQCPSLANIFTPPEGLPANRRFSCRRVSSPLGLNRRSTHRNSLSLTPPPTTTPPLTSVSPLARRFSVAPPSYSTSPPSSLGGRRSSLKPSGNSPGSLRGFPRQQPLRPRFKIGPCEDDVTKPSRVRYDTS